MEAVSCDELFIDCTELLADTGATPLDFATLLRRQIEDATRCTASAGLGTSLTTSKKHVTKHTEKTLQFCL